MTTKSRCVSVLSTTLVGVPNGGDSAEGRDDENGQSSDDDETVAFFCTDPKFNFEDLDVKAEDMQLTECFYCGDERDSTVCDQCAQCLCADCQGNVGCTCMIADGQYATVVGFVPKPGQAKATTFSKAQRKAVMRAAKVVEDQDEAMWTALKGRASPLKKCLLAITTLTNAFENAIGQITTFIDPGPKGTSCNASMLDSLHRTVEDQDPAVIYLHVPFEDDKVSSPGYDLLKDFTEKQMKSGRTCIVADTRHADRWTGVEPTRCRGDLALHCNDQEICSELVEWAKSKDHGYPRCTNDLEEVEFADILAGLAEAHHLDKCVDAAFAGTEEAAAETPLMDGIFGPEDEGKQDDHEMHDAEHKVIPAQHPVD